MHASQRPARTLARIALLACLTAWIPDAPAAAKPLLPGPRFTTAGDPGAVAAGDMNADGVTDLVAVTTGASPDDDGVRLLLGNGDGSFQAPLEVATADHPRDVEVADLDGDGVLDIAFTDFPAGEVRILIGVGDGSFLEGAALVNGAYTWRLDVADVNGDHHADVLTPNDGGRVFLGNGDGTFLPPLPLGLIGNTTSAEAHDLDADGKPDLVSLDSTTGTIDVRLGNGDGSFGAPHAIAHGIDVATVPVVEDVDDDGSPDLVVPLFTDGIALLRGNGDASFQAPITIHGGWGPFVAGVADIDGDGALDVLAVGGERTAGERASAWVLLGNGDASFQPAVTYPVGAHPVGLAIADLDGDHVPDLASAGKDAGGISVLLGKGDGTLLAPTFVGSGFNPNALSAEDALAALDLDGDAHVDLLTLDAVLLGDGKGSFPVVLPIASGDAPIDFALGPVDGDDLPDLVVLNQAEDGVRVLLGNGDGTFGAASFVPVDGYPADLALGDLDGDGAADLVTVEPSRQRIAILLGDGSGGFGEPNLVPLEGAPERVAVADFDGDGLLDVAVVENHQLGLRPGNGDGTLQPPIYSALGTITTFLEVVDLDGDGALDFLATGSDYTAALFGNGDGTFTPTTLSDPDGPRLWYPVIAADVDADGRLDLVSRGPELEDIAVMLAEGDRSFAAPAFFTANDLVGSLTAADLDEDGFVDLIGVEQPFDKRIVLWLNQSGSARVCDVDEDGDVDRLDVRAILRALWHEVEPGDPRDADGDGRITVHDARDCAEACDLDGCRVVYPRCGLLGIEPALLLGWLRLRRRQRGAGG